MILFSISSWNFVFKFFYSAIVLLSIIAVHAKLSELLKSENTLIFCMMNSLESKLLFRDYHRGIY